MLTTYSISTLTKLFTHTLSLVDFHNKINLQNKSRNLINYIDSSAVIHMNRKSCP